MTHPALTITFFIALLCSITTVLNLIDAVKDKEKRNLWLFLEIVWVCFSWSVFFYFAANKSQTDERPKDGYEIRPLDKDSLIINTTSTIHYKDLQNFFEKDNE